MLSVDLVTNSLMEPQKELQKEQRQVPLLQLNPSVQMERIVTASVSLKFQFVLGAGMQTQLRPGSLGHTTMQSFTSKVALAAAIRVSASFAKRTKDKLFHLKH